MQNGHLLIDTFLEITKKTESLPVIQFRSISGANKMLCQTINPKIKNLITEEALWTNGLLNLEYNYELKHDLLLIRRRYTLLDWPECHMCPDEELESLYPDNESFQDSFVVDLSSGSKVRFADNLTFKSIFSLQGYMAFCEKYFLPKAKAISLSDQKCVEYSYNISSPIDSFRSVESGFQSLPKNIYNEIWLYLEVDHARATRCCDEQYSFYIPYDSLISYLSPYGKEVMIQYRKLSGLDKILYRSSLEPESDQWPQRNYYLAVIDSQYLVKMALSIEKDSSISGYYYYDNNYDNQLTLEGKYNNESNNIELTESYNGKTTGFFKIKEAKKNYEDIDLEGTWTGPSKSLNIQLFEIKHN